jgi:hypothetical protein
VLVEVACDVDNAGRRGRRARRAPVAVRRGELGEHLELADGKPLAFGLELVGAGYPLRAASALSGVPRSTLHEHLHAPV